MEKTKFAGIVKAISFKSLRIGENGLQAAGRPASVAVSALMVVWCVGRVMEALNGHTVFDTKMTYWFGLAVVILIAIWTAGFAAATIEALRKTGKQKIIFLSWAFFLVLVAIVVFNLGGFRISAAGLFSALAGSRELSQQASFLLIKFHPANPMLALNLAALKLMGAGWDIQALAAYVWNWNTVFVVLIWSFAFGVVLLMRKDHVFLKTLCFSLAAFGLVSMIFLKSESAPSVKTMIVYQAVVLLLLVFQILLAYATIRASAKTSVETSGEGIPKKQSSADMVQYLSDEPNKALEKRLAFLPPSGLALALTLIFALPILTDLQGQYKLSKASNRILSNLSLNSAKTPAEFVTVAPISVRSGPAAGDDIVGVLPEGTRISILGEKYNCVLIGRRQWVQEKFLRPLNPKRSTTLNVKRNG